MLRGALQVTVGEEGFYGASSPYLSSNPGQPGEGGVHGGVKEAGTRGVHVLGGAWACALVLLQGAACGSLKRAYI